MIGPEVIRAVAIAVGVVGAALVVGGTMRAWLDEVFVGGILLAVAWVLWT